MPRSNKTGSFLYTVEEFEHGDSWLTLELEVSYSVSAYTPMSMYGGPDHVGWPAEGGEIEDLDYKVIKVTDENGIVDSSLVPAIKEEFDKQFDKYQEKIEEKCREELEDEPDWDAIREERRLRESE